MAQNAAAKEMIDMGRRRVHMPGKYIILILFVPVSLVAVGAGFWLNFQERRAAYAAVEYRKSAEGLREAYYSLPEFLVDLRADDDGRTGYLRVKASVLLNKDGMSKTVQNIDALLPMLNERLTFFLREMRPEDFDSSEDMNRIKREMLRRINLVIAPNSADDVIIEELVIQ